MKRKQTRIDNNPYLGLRNIDYTPPVDHAKINRVIAEWDRTGTGNFRQYILEHIRGDWETIGGSD